MINSTNNIKLTTAALTGWKAMLLELGTIVACTIGVILIAGVAQEGHSQSVLWTVPLAALTAGVLGVLLADKYACGLLLNFRYIATYMCTIGLMVGVDMLVCLWLEGNLWIVLRNWMILIGSASCVNIFWSRYFANYLYQKIDPTRVDNMHPAIIISIMLLQVVQMFISVLGMTWVAAIAQIVARRIFILPVTHLIAKLNYGSHASALAQTNRTVEYIGVNAITNDQGVIKEKDTSDVTVAGTMLLKLPIFGGRLLKFDRKSWVTLIDELIFLEQILAFSSPTMVVSSRLSLLHLAYVWKITTAEGEQQTNKLLNQRMKCKQLLHNFIVGDRRTYINTALSED